MSAKKSAAKEAIVPVELAEGEGVERPLDLEEQRLLSTLDNRRSLTRACHQGVPFYLTSSADRFEFAEHVVYGLVSAELLRVTQAALVWPLDRPRLPFSVVLTKEGEVARIRVLRRLDVSARFPEVSDHRLAA